MSGFFVGLAFLFLLGSGPALWLLTPARSSLAALAAAPGLGFALLGLLSTPLVFNDFPVKDWALPLALVCATLGAASAAWAIWQRRLGTELDAKLWAARLPLAALTGVLVLLLLPPLIGGANYTVFRGNQWDAFNYYGMAQSMDENPFSRLRQGDEQALLDEHSYQGLMRRHLVNERQSTSIALAFFARLAGQPVSLFGYHFCLLSLALLFPLVVLFATELGLARSWACLAGAAACVGFWGQLVLDSNAFSQINALPLGVLCALGVLWAADGKEPSAVKASLFAALGLAGVAIFYAEYLPFLGLGLLLFLGWQAWSGRAPEGALKRAGLALAFMLVLLLPELDFYRRFLLRQSRFVADNGSLWWSYFYSWLMERAHPQKFVPGYWGFYLLRSLSEGKAAWIKGLVSGFCYAGGLGLGALVALNLPRLLGRRAERAWALNACLVMASLLIFAGLGATGRWWPAGKAISFGAAFALLAATAAALSGQGSRIWPTAFRTLAVAWLGVQALYGPLRVLRAAQGKDYPFPYPSIQDPGLKRASYELGALEGPLKALGPGAVAVDISQDWLAEFVDLRFSGARTWRLRNVPDYHTGPGKGWMNPKTATAAVLIEKASYAGGGHKFGELLAETPDLALHRISPAALKKLAEDRRASGKGGGR